MSKVSPFSDYRMIPTGIKKPGIKKPISSCQFSSVAQSCLTLCDPMDCSMLGLPVLHQLLELFKLMSIESVIPPNSLILCRPLFLLPSVFPSIRVFSSEPALWIPGDPLGNHNAADRVLKNFCCLSVIGFQPDNTVGREQERFKFVDVCFIAQDIVYLSALSMCT